MLGAVAFPACGDLIYDDDEGGSESVTDSRFSLVDATSYTSWTYVNLREKTTTVVKEYGKGPYGTPPAEWNFALHRYDCKTNGGAALETQYTSLKQLGAGAKPTGVFVEDEWTDDRVIIDLSGMLEERIGYAETYYNAEFSRWMDLDLSIMPPTFTTSNRVYILRLADGTHAALRFTDFMNGAGVKGYISFDYIYPYEY